MFSKLLCIVNISCYKKEQLILHQSLLGVKGGGAKQPSPTFNCNAKMQYFFTKSLVKSTTNSTKLLENVHKNIINILSISFLKLGGGENNPVGSSISDQCYFNVNYDQNASTRACFLNFPGSKLTHSKSVAGE